MDNFIIEGGHELFGEVNISGAKNAAVAIIPAAILADDVVRIENIPAISDVSLIIKILDSMGAGIKMINKNTIEVDSRSLKCQSVPYELTSCFRASYYLIGAMLGRFKQAQVAMPGHGVARRAQRARQPIIAGNVLSHAMHQLNHAAAGRIRLPQVQGERLARDRGEGDFLKRNHAKAPFRAKAVVI